jgi:hypothetical protein
LTDSSTTKKRRIQQSNFRRRRPHHNNTSTHPQQYGGKVTSTAIWSHPCSFLSHGGCQCPGTTRWKISRNCRHVQSHCQQTRHEGNSIKGGSAQVLVGSWCPTHRSNGMDLGKIWNLAATAASFQSAKEQTKEGGRRKEIKENREYQLFSHYLNCRQQPNASPGTDILLKKSPVLLTSW